MRNIEQAAREKYASRTFIQLERALLWSDGTVSRILNGTATAADVGEESLDWERLAIEVKRRRVERRRPVDLSDFGGPSEMTVRKIESGEPVSIRPQSRVRLEYALEWRDGVVDRILDGTVTDEDLREVVAREKPAEAAELSVEDESALRIGRLVLALLTEVAQHSGPTPEARARMSAVLAGVRERNEGALREMRAERADHH